MYVLVRYTLDVIYNLLSVLTINSALVAEWVEKGTPTCLILTNHLSNCSVQHLPNSPRFSIDGEKGHYKISYASWGPQRQQGKVSESKKTGDENAQTLYHLLALCF